MIQGSLFDEPDPPPPASPDAPAATATAPPRPMLDIEERNRLWDEAKQVIGGWSPTLETLRHAASGYFRAITAGKTYKRRPALKVMVPGPGSRLAIEPSVLAGGRRSFRSVEVNPDHIVLSLFETDPYGRMTRELLRVILTPGGGTTLTSCYPETGPEDAERACGIAARFIADPEGTIATSGTHCVFCRKALTDPASRARGIGPECFSHYGDFLKYLRAAPAVDD